MANQRISGEPEIESDVGDVADDYAQSVAVRNLEGRHWIEAIRSFALMKRSSPNERVQYALDMAMVAALERAERIFRSDLPEETEC